MLGCVKLADQPTTALRVDMKHSCQRNAQIFDRRRLLSTAIAAGGLLSLPGCVSTAARGEPDLVWGRRGWSEGRFVKPRTIAIDSADRLYICDTTGRIQVFDADGNFQTVWSTPETANGRPTGLEVRAADEHIDREVLLVADTHYYRMLAYELDGTLIDSRCIGGTAGYGPGEFAFVTEAVCDDDGCFYIGEYGDSDRIQKFDPDGRFIAQWGGTGDQPGQFIRPQSMIVTDGLLWVTDAGNHRMQAFDVTADPPGLVHCWGVQGPQAGQLYYPYDIALMEGEPSPGRVDLMICEYGNQRIQRFATDGTSLGILGGPGFEDGQFHHPWGLVVDSKRRVHVLDSNNHRIQRFPT
ncbi:NHL repeat protein [Crateriforma conspicua]|uniref:NHL repeat protein n=1 Tax=Crateriforma conspicua TaxID=2527996 RepID=A0A5C5Y4F6_9PLAN|nr:NHL repeat protein [Crateriforma conspicua]TWT69613.1 NHL repeat protein [Crateriforma conspicua]